MVGFIFFEKSALTELPINALHNFVMLSVIIP